MTKTSILRISEGLGNQLFMYAHAYAFSKKMGYDLHVDSESAYKKLKIRTFMLNNFNIDLKKASRELIPDNFFKYCKYKLNKKVDFFRHKKKFLIEKRYGNKLTMFNDYTKDKYADNIFIEGYFESEKFFKDYIDYLRKSFVIKKIDKDSLAINPSRLKKENSVSIVIRQHRFSEKNNNNINKKKSDLFVKDTINYIFKAVDFIVSKIENPKFYIFSNDTSNLKEVFKKNNFQIINHSTNKILNDFYLSTHCKHFIVGPSTFHWWSAYLGSDTTKLCIHPPNKIKFSSNKDIYPDGWIDIY